MVGRAPDFLCVGTQKAATTWLHRCLSAHPDIWMPYVGEIHYFNHKDSPNSQSRRVWRVAFQMGHQQNLALKQDVEPFARWAYRYIAPRRPNDDWYLSLFEEAGSRLTGDITPNYCSLDMAGMEHMRRLLPDSKLIFLMRHPVERCWSGFRTQCGVLGWEIEEAIKQSRHITYMEDQTCIAMTSYHLCISRLESLWPKEQLFFGFYERVMADPQGLLGDICSFLGLEPHPAMLEPAQKRFHVSKNIPMPADLPPVIARIYRDEMAKLAVRFPDPVGQWVADLDAILAGSSNPPRFTL